MKLLELCLSPDLGGLELYVQQCAHALSTKADVTTVIAHNSRLEEYLEGLKVFSLRRKSSFSLITAYKLARIIDSQKIETVHMHWTKDLPTAVVAKLLSKQKPKLIQTRHMTMTRFKDDIYHRFLYKNLDAVICVTKAVESQVKKFIPARICPKTQTLYPGVERKKLLNAQELDTFRQSLGIKDEFVISIIGRINAFKGQHLVIEAVAMLQKKHHHVKAFIVGHAMDEAYLQKLQERVKALGLQEDVIFTGFTKEADKYMQASDTVVMASKNETFGLVTVEAMACQTAVVAANSGGALEVIDDEKNGLLFESGNALDLANKLQHLSENEKLCEYLKVNGFNQFHKLFNNKQHFNQLNEMFKSFVN